LATAAAAAAAAAVTRGDCQTVQQVTVDVLLVIHCDVVCDVMAAHDTRLSLLLMLLFTCSKVTGMFATRVQSC